MTPLARSLALLRDRGYTVARAEHWNAFAHVRQDLFGFVDLVAIRAGASILAVQVTVQDRAGDHRRKIEKNEAAQTWLEAGGRIELHLWAVRKDGGRRARWTCHIESASREPRHSKSSIGD